MRQATTQELRAKIDEGRETVLRARRMISARFGPWNETIVRFGIAPIRRRSRRRRKEREAAVP